MYIYICIKKEYKVRFYGDLADKRKKKNLIHKRSVCSRIHFCVCAYYDIELITFIDRRRQSCLEFRRTIIAIDQPIFHLDSTEDVNQWLKGVS